MRTEASEASRSFFSCCKAETISSSSATREEVPASASNYIRVQRAATKDFRARSSAHCRALAAPVSISLFSIRGEAEGPPGLRQELVLSVAALETEASNDLTPNKFGT